ncbi:MAG: hypothetical protein LBJ36_10970 [Synergistaceae bacterium]|nr:hypothetical protein [Synergistaceae bacterium]
MNMNMNMDAGGMLEVTKCAPQMAIMQLGAAFRNFFTGCARYPTFRKKGAHDRFSMSNDQFDVKGFHIRIPIYSGLHRFGRTVII